MAANSILGEPRNGAVFQNQSPPIRMSDAQLRVDQFAPPPSIGHADPVDTNNYVANMKKGNNNILVRVIVNANRWPSGVDHSVKKS